MSKDETKLKAKVDEYFEKYMCVSFEKFIENWEQTKELLLNKDKEIEKLREENLLLRASEPMSKLQEDYGYKAEVEKLNRLISQREQKWEKWTTEKQILSSKMSDYLCKYQNIKREYTKQIKISTDRKKEIERLNNIINELEEWLNEKIWLNKNDKDYINGMTFVGVNLQMYRMFLDKLQELKGYGSNG